MLKHFADVLYGRSPAAAQPTDAWASRTSFLPSSVWPEGRERGWVRRRRVQKKLEMVVNQIFAEYSHPNKADLRTNADSAEYRGPTKDSYLPRVCEISSQGL